MTNNSVWPSPDTQVAQQGRSDVHGVYLLDPNTQKATAPGAGTQYKDGDATPANPVGTMPIFDNGGTISRVSVANPLPVSATVTVSPSTNQRVNAHVADFVDGADVTQGTSTQTKATDGSATSWSVIQLLKGMFDKLLNSIAVTGTFWQATQPVSGTFWQATQPISGAVSQSGTWTEVPNAATSGGSTPYHLMSAATTNATSLKGSTGQIYGFSFSNANAAIRYVKLYNKASAPTVGSDTPIMTMLIPANALVARAFPVGLAFSSGIAFSTNTGIADTDTGAVGLNDLSIDIDYK